MSPRCKNDGSLIPRYEDWHKRTHGTKRYLEISELCKIVATRRGAENEDRALRVAQEVLDPKFSVRRATFEEDQRGFDFFICGQAGEVLPIQVKSSFIGKTKFEKTSNVPVLVVNPWYTDNIIGQYVTNFAENFFC